jgi:uncharacterized protein YndB with AHSA1/START domain
MSAARHVYQIFIKSTPEDVWRAITDPEFTHKYFHRTRFERDTAGPGPFRYVLPDGREAVEGQVEEIEPPTRLVMTWRVLYDTAMSQEPPSRVEWQIDTAGDGLTRVKVVHRDLARSPLTWASVKDGWVWVLDGLKTLVETGEPLPDQTVELEDEITDAQGEWHRAEAVQANNSVWDLLTSADRTADEDEDLLRRAYAAAYHWARAARRGPENEARAEYMIARAQAELGRGEMAMHHARRCMAATEAAALADFDLAYAHEALARAFALVGDGAAADRELAAARAVPIADPEDEEILRADLDAAESFLSAHFQSVGT